jgi:hypothetical protein
VNAVDVNVIVEIITLIGVLVTAASGIYLGLKTLKKQSVIQAVTSNRIGRIDAMRSAMLDFLAEYLKDGAPGRYELILARAKVELYFRSYRPAYYDLKLWLDICTEQRYTPKNFELLVMEMQNVLDYRWRRVKQEAGLGDKSDTPALDELKGNIKTERKDQKGIMKDHRKAIAEELSCPDNEF